MEIADIKNELKYENVHLFESEQRLEVTFTRVENIKRDNVCNFLDLKKEPDEIELVISYYGSQETIVKNKDDKDELNEFFEIDRDCVDLSINIIKHHYTKEYIKNINIYDVGCFEGYLLELENLEVMNNFGELFQNCQFIFFKTNQNLYIQTKGFVIGNAIMVNNQDILKREKKISSQRYCLNFNGNININFLPEDFNIIYKNRKTQLGKKFDEIRDFLSIVYLSDVSYISDNQLVYSIYGKRDNMDFSIRNSVFFELYQWVFENENYYEKLMTTKNIISSLNKDEIDRNTMDIILSNYRLFQMKHVEKYFELKKDLASNILENNERFFNISSRIFSDFSKSIIGFFSFIFTVVVVNVATTGNLNNIFTSDIIKILYILLFSAYVVLIVTISRSLIEIRQIQKSHDRLISNYLDVFNEKGLSSLMKDDFEKEKKNAQRIIVISAILWFVLVTLMIFIIDKLVANDEMKQLVIKLLLLKR